LPTPDDFEEPIVKAMKERK